jgi:hypothetical protein
MFNLILNDLKKQFGEKILLTPLDIAKITGVSIGQQSNQRSNQSFPIPWSKDFGRIKISIYDLAHYLANQGGTSKEQKRAINPPPRISSKPTKGHLEKDWWLS